MLAESLGTNSSVAIVLRDANGNIKDGFRTKPKILHPIYFPFNISENIKNLILDGIDPLNELQLRIQDDK